MSSICAGGNPMMMIRCDRLMAEKHVYMSFPPKSNCLCSCCSARGDPTMTLHIGILLFPEVQQLDLTGPYEIFASTPDTKVHLLWKELGPIQSATGLPLMPTATLADCPLLDVLVVPGGRGVNALMQDEEVIAFVRFQASQVRYLTAVCTGSLVLGAAGLLQGCKATTHWFSHDLLERFGAHPVKQRVVRDGTIITAGGVTAGIDFALTIVAELFDE